MHVADLPDSTTPVQRGGSPHRGFSNSDGFRGPNADRFPNGFDLCRLRDQHAFKVFDPDAVELVVQ
jgi:hypothetical protein